MKTGNYFTIAYILYLYRLANSLIFGCIRNDYVAIADVIFRGMGFPFYSKAINIMMKKRNNFIVFDKDIAVMDVMNATAVTCHQRTRACIVPMRLKISQPYALPAFAVYVFFATEIPIHKNARIFVCLYIMWRNTQ